MAVHKAAVLFRFKKATISYCEDIVEFRCPSEVASPQTNWATHPVPTQQPYLVGLPGPPLRSIQENTP